ncbi:MAG TPA: YitT family protein [Ignavibacteriaceae bacterium]|nr:YitT family protein [Ignavibacteriaceae bacterium]
MNSIWTRFVTEIVLRKKNKPGRNNNDQPDKDFKKRLYEASVTVKYLLFDALLIILGIFSAGFGLKSFLLPNQFIDGGATGISLLITEVTGISLSLLIIAVNIPFIIFGLKILGKKFVLKTSLAILGLALVVAFIPYPYITHDKLLVSVFGGFFLGAGIGLSVRGGAVIDGTEVLAIFLNRKTTLTVGDVILIINIVIFSAAAYLLSIETALYSILTYLAASKTVDFIIEGIEEYTGVTIISDKYEEIRQMILQNLQRGVTVYKGEKGLAKPGDEQKDIKIIYTVITRLEIRNLNTEIEKVDPNAFVIMNSIKDTKGGMIKKRPLK